MDGKTANDDKGKEWPIEELATRDDSSNEANEDEKREQAGSSSKADGMAKLEAKDMSMVLNVEKQDKVDEANRTSAEDGDQAELDACLALPTNLHRQTVRTMRTTQPGAIAVAGINASTDGLLSHMMDGEGRDASTSNTTDPEHSEGNDTLSPLVTPGAQETSFVIEAQLVEESTEYNEIVDRLNYKEQELHELTEKLRSMETLKQEVEALRRMISDAIPVHSVSLEDGNRQKQRRPGTSGLTKSESHAMKALLGDPFSKDFSDDDSSELRRSTRKQDPDLPTDRSPDKSGDTQSKTSPESSGAVSTSSGTAKEPMVMDSCCVIL